MFVDSDGVFCEEGGRPAYKARVGKPLSIGEALSWGWTVKTIVTPSAEILISVGGERVLSAHCAAISRIADGSAVCPQGWTVKTYKP